jgi:hypothetical protein
MFNVKVTPKLLGKLAIAIVAGVAAEALWPGYGKYLGVLVLIWAVQSSG